MLQFSENTAIGNKSIEGVSSAPIPTEKNDGVLYLISDGIVDRSALQDMGAWPTHIFYYLRDFLLKRSTIQLQNTTFIFPRTKVDND
jgi:hypothetical protein